MMTNLNHQAPPPPPPYDCDNGAVTRSELDPRNKTIPKCKQEASMSQREKTSCGELPCAHIGSAYDDSTCNHHLAASARRKPPASREQHLQFVNSLSAPRRLFGYITVEPLAFLALLALYIEFPSIQDLIYTKICLQVVANHPNITFSPNRTTITTAKPIDFQVIPLNFTGLGSQLSWFGKIQSNSTASNITQPNGGQQVPRQQLANDGERDHSLCDRLDKSALPAYIRQEIADGDSLFWLKYQIIICLLCALSSPYWGGMSDKIGRLLPLNVPIFVAIISNSISLLFGLLISLDSHSLFHVNWLYLGAILTGLSGGQAVVIVNSFSFISDNTCNESRSKRVAVLESVIFISHSVGFYLTKHIMSLGLDQFQRAWLNRHFVAFLTCAILNLICVLYSYFKLRHHNFHRFLNNFEREQQESFSTADILHDTIQETRGATTSLDITSVSSQTSVLNTNRLREVTTSNSVNMDSMSSSEKSWSDLSNFLTFKYYKDTYVTATKHRESRPLILLLLICGFISAMSLAALMSLLYIYLRMEPFGWTTGQYSYWNSASSISRGVALVFLTLCMKFIKTWQVPDPLIASIGFLSKGIGLTMIATAKSSSTINWSLLAFILSEYSMPPLRSLLSKLVVREEVAKVYSCLSAVQSVCFLVGNVIFYLAYSSLGLQDFFRISFLVVAGFQFAAVLIMIFIYTMLRRRVVIV